MGVRHPRIYGGHVLLRASPILSKSDEEPTINKFRLIGKYIDMVSLAVFGVIWVSVTVGFMAAMSS